MLKAATWIARASLYVASAALAVIVVLVAGSAIMRYLVGSPFGFTEELVGLLFSALVFLAMAYCAIFNKAIQVDIVYDILSTPLKTAGRIIAKLATFIFAIWLGWLVYDFIRLSYDIGAKTYITRITLWPWMSLFLLMVGGLVLSVFWQAEGDASEDEEGIDLT